MFICDGGKRKEKRLEYFNRDRKSILLIDHNTISEELNPGNTVLVLPFSAKPGTTAGVGASDPTCASIKALVSFIREDVSSSGTGQVNIPLTLSRLKERAQEAGFSSDASGLFGYLSKTAAEEEELEREKRNSGLGGLLRRSAVESPLLRTKATTYEAAGTRSYRDPGVELGEDSLLTKKVREAGKKLWGR
jgi:hypothetical protein